MSHNISRRSIAKGAAWAAPVTLAATSIPAYAASTNVSYELSGSWMTRYQVATNGWSCGYDGWSAKGYLTKFQFYTDVSVLGATPGFGVYELNGSPTTGVTLNNLQIQVAYPVGYVKSMTVTKGSYTVSGPQRMSVPGAKLSQYDVFTFTFTGPTRGTSAPTELASTWTGSPLNTTVDFNTSICVPQSLGVYYIRFLGSFTTDNGFTRNFADFGWLETPYG